jgi:hypothetical protein
MGVIEMEMEKIRYGATDEQIAQWKSEHECDEDIED